MTRTIVLMAVVGLVGCMSPQEIATQGWDRAVATANAHCEAEGKTFRLSSSDVVLPTTFTDGSVGVHGTCVPAAR